MEALITIRVNTFVMFMITFPTDLKSKKELVRAHLAKFLSATITKTKSLLL